MSDLKPCPFCGSKAEEDWGAVTNITGGEYQLGTIECKECEASVGYEINDINGDWDTGGVKLRNKWNTRYTPEEAVVGFDTTQQQYEALRGVSNSDTPSLDDKEEALMRR